MEHIMVGTELFTAVERNQTRMEIFTKVVGHMLAGVSALHQIWPLHDF